MTWRDATVFIAEWPIHNPDLPMIHIKAKARDELRHMPIYVVLDWDALEDRAHP